MHLARGSNLKWVQEMGGWASAKLLLDLYGHFLPMETTGFADALTGAPRRPYTAPLGSRTESSSRRVAKSRARTRGCVAPREGVEPPTRRLEGDCSIHLSYRGAPDTP